MKEQIAYALVNRETGELTTTFWGFLKLRKKPLLKFIFRYLCLFPSRYLYSAKLFKDEDEEIVKVKIVPYE